MRLLPESNIPPRARSVGLRDIQSAPVRSAIKLYLEQVDELGALGIAPAFLGKGGEYKTLGAAVIARRLRDIAHVPVKWVSVATDFNHLERNRFSSDTSSTISEWQRISFLVVDDFTQCKPGSFGADLLLELAEFRYNHQLPTLWTGNIAISRTDTSNLEKLYGQAFTRRFVEGCKGHCLVLKG